MLLQREPSQVVSQYMDGNKMETHVTVNGLTGELFERELNSSEIAERQEFQKEFEAEQVQRQAKADARQSALAKLAALGLTQEEIETL